MLRQAQQNANRAIVLEDESRLIGRIAVPEVLRERSMHAPLVIVESSLAQRTEHTYHNYILQNLEDWRQCMGDAEGFIRLNALRLKLIATRNARVKG